MASSTSHPVSPTRSGRHQIRRSITEVASPPKIQRAIEEHRHEHRHRHHHSHRKDRQKTEGAPYSALPAFHLRHSLDLPRPNDASLLDPSHSRRPSGVLHKGDDVKLSKQEEEKLKQEREKALFRAE